MPIPRALLGLLLLAPAVLGSQALAPELAHGRDYVFERIVARREVRDARDTGFINLVSYVYRPLKNDRHEVVLYSHGSTGGISTSPAEPTTAPAQPVIRFFVSRGYTLVAPQRRGRNESGGHYMEECSAFTGECTAADQVALTDVGLREALLDTYAVLDQVVFGKIVPRDSRIIAAGHSRGGFLSLMLAGERPALVKAVVNLSGGWHGVTDRLPPDQIAARTASHETLLAAAAKRATAPTFWVYAARDPLYRDGVPQSLVKAWQAAGGRAELVYVAEHTLQNGHQTPQNPGFWEKQLDAFLKTIP